ncbi:hypothetical protein VCHA44O286_190050 [Vibrio chagasii]|nr:hypothetical protein VCHA44O286_190050 [Vibrio chagasii]
MVLSSLESLLNDLMIKLVLLPSGSLSRGAYAEALTDKALMEKLHSSSVDRRRIEDCLGWLVFLVYRYKKRPLESGRFDSQLTNESLVNQN